MEYHVGRGRFQVAAMPFSTTEILLEHEYMGTSRRLFGNFHILDEKLNPNSFIGCQLLVSVSLQVEQCS